MFRISGSGAARSCLRTRHFALSLVLLTAGCGTPDTSQDATQAGAYQPMFPSTQQQPAPHATPARASDPAPRNATRRIDVRGVISRLESAGLEVEDLGTVDIAMDDLSRFPTEPRSTALLRVSDGKGNASPIKFVEFDSWKDAAALDAKPINGFAVRNWFMYGTVNNYFVGLLTEALNR